MAADNYRGLLLTPPMTVDGDAIYLKSNKFDPQELRVALLFWDRFFTPSSTIVNMNMGPEADYLIETGLLTTKSYFFTGDFAQDTVKAFVAAHEELNEQAPGKWSMSQGENSLLVLGGAELQESSGLSVRLYKALPVPNYDVPLNDILEFKEKRRDELLRLRLVLDETFLKLSKLDVEDLAIETAIGEIDLACKDVLRIGSESKMKMMLSDWKMSVNINANTVYAGAAGAILGSQFGLPEVTALLGTAAGAINFKKDFALGTSTKAINPYRYVHSYHKDLFISNGS